MNTDLWYCSYGSNLYFERFKLYILGGTAPFIENHFPGCSDKRLPKEDFGYRIPYEMYFSKSSKAWEKKAVAFISHHADSTKTTLCRIYKITKAQFEQIILQENALDPQKNLFIDYEKLYREGSFLIETLMKKNKWYPKLMVVGSKDNLPVLTFTSQTDVKDASYSLPGHKYLTTILKGLRQSHPDLTQEDLSAYLQPLKGIKGHYSESQLKKIIHEAF